VKEAAGPIAGKFKVIRMEIGYTEMGLGDIITRNIEKQLREWNIDFKFPPADKITENKTSFEDLMAAFDAAFPGSGLLVVVDEMLDYLRSRNEQALTLDLGFLREIGGVCKDLRFRFIAGVQEAIFDSDRFSFVAESVSRGKDRFKQIRIQKTDITYVVANRLLKKTEHQKAKVRDYLEPFAKFYDGWTEALPEFVDLFPVHPNYIQTFERLPIVEQRGVLQVLSQVMEATDPSEFTGFRIWESAMPWNEKNVTKLGWLFFSVPSERSTAQPPRDFYVYFPQIIDPPKFKDEKKADEVFFRVDATDEKFRDVLGRYAAALALKANASGTKKQEYARKSDLYFKELARWLHENFLSKVKVTYRGHAKALSRALAGENASGLTTREQVFLAASKHLNEHFEEICGDYPKFTRQLTFGRNGNIEQAVHDALRALHTNATQTGAAVLDGLSLYDGEQRIEPRQSPYAKFVLEQLGTELNQWVEKLVLMRQEFSGGIPFWGTKLLKDDEIAAASDQLDTAKQFLESLQAYNTPAKLKNFKYFAEEVAGHRPALDRAREIETMKGFADSISEYTAYLSNAQSILPDDHPWCGKSRKLKSEICEEVLDPKKGGSGEFRNKVIRGLKALKQEYIDIYLEAYRHSRLDPHLDKRKQALLNDAKMRQLKALATIPTMNVSQLTEIQSEFGRLKTGDNISRVVVSPKALEAALFPSGAATTVEDFKDRFAAYLDSLVKGQDRAKVRLVLGERKGEEE